MRWLAQKQVVIVNIVMNVVAEPVPQYLDFAYTDRIRSDQQIYTSVLSVYRDKKLQYY
ncbi:contoxin-like protein [Trichoplusia ni single nucleopolyhedrovirus]|uniref:Contoxin-like protein n=1 Tax=Trichoplusia ni single nucleopolyhedrovirus TaxID=332054 RepID=Q461Z7_9ABAC|nr:contoxin-like protein [Trichoplusia ni single nucleopolyhedrovirus]AAZ67439.1 contoxin-like protein [Trichoplusia ni single nucleopolyhedrovirus]